MLKLDVKFSSTRRRSKKFLIWFGPNFWFTDLSFDSNSRVNLASFHKLWIWIIDLDNNWSFVRFSLKFLRGLSKLILILFKSFLSYCRSLVFWNRWDLKTRLVMFKLFITFKDYLLRVRLLNRLIQRDQTGWCFISFMNFDYYRSLLVHN